MQWLTGGAVMRHCHIVLLHAAAAAVLICLVMSALGKSSNQLSIHEGAGIDFRRDRGLKGHHTPVADVSPERQVWLYSLVGTDFPGALSRTPVTRCKRKGGRAHCSVPDLVYMWCALAALRCANAAAERCCRCRNAAAALAAALHQPGLPAGAHDSGGPHEKQWRAPQQCSLACAQNGFQSLVAAAGHSDKRRSA